MATYTLEVASINARPVTTKFGARTAFDLIAKDGTKYKFKFTNPATMGIGEGSIITATGAVGDYGIELDPKSATLRPPGTAMETPAGGSGPAAATPARTYTTKPFPLPKDHGDTAIIRQNALTNAVATVADFIATQPTEKWPTIEEWQELVITTAYKYAEFSSGQREVRVAKARLGDGMTAEEMRKTLDAHLGEEAA